MSEPTAHPGASLRSRGMSGTIWMLSTGSIVLLSQLVVVAALARVLSVEELGVVTLSIAAMNMAMLLGGFGLARGLVRLRTLTADDETSAFVGCLATGSAAWIACAIAAPGIARFFDIPALAELIVIGGATFVVVAGFQVPLALLERAMRFRAIGAAQAFGFALPTAIVTIAIALRGGGVSSAVWGTLTGRIVQCVVLASAAGWRPRGRLTSASATVLAHFGLHSTGASAVAFATANIDYMVVGRLLGPTALGLYTVAYQLATAPRSRIGQALSAVTFSALAQIQDDLPRFCRSYITLNRYVGFIVFPALAVLFVLAEPIVEIAFGSRWLPAAPVLRILCPAGALMAIRSTAGSALSAIGSPDLSLYANLGVLLCSIPIFVVLVPYGLQSTAYAVLLIAILDFFPLQLMLRHKTGLELGRLLVGIAPPSVLAVVLGVCVWGVVPASASAPARLALGGFASAGLYVGFIMLLGREFVRDIVAAASAFRGRP